jgi:hypothetical protein
MLVAVVEVPMVFSLQMGRAEQCPQALVALADSAHHSLAQLAAKGQLLQLEALPQQILELVAVVEVPTRLYTLGLTAAHQGPQAATVALAL